MKFRKKPVVIDAVQWFKDGDHPAVIRCECATYGNCVCSQCGKAFVRTIEGPLHVSSGDWIITGVQGEHHPCKPDIFKATYEYASTAVPEVRAIKALQEIAECYECSGSQCREIATKALE